MHSIQPHGIDPIILSFNVIDTCLGLEKIRSRKQGDAECYVSIPETDAHSSQINCVPGHQVKKLQSNSNFKSDLNQIQVKMYGFQWLLLFSLWHLFLF